MGPWFIASSMLSGGVFKITLSIDNVAISQMHMTNFHNAHQIIYNQLNDDPIIKLNSHQQSASTVMSFSNCCSYLDLIDTIVIIPNPPRSTTFSDSMLPLQPHWTPCRKCRLLRSRSDVTANRSAFRSPLHDPSLFSSGI